ncbi:MAG: 16S rRNA (uracil(1498)-N(3))-methyltransferase [bacterium]|nr:16S rRNA (uracil(1498)-N(3))-methyltransferase [bacterium]
MRFFVDAPLPSRSEVTLPEEVAHHLVRVLRTDVGTRFRIFNGEGGSHGAELIEAGKKSARVQLLDFQADDQQSPLLTHLGQVMSRGERMDYAIQKATELGVTEITPLSSERCELKLRGDDRAGKKTEHWRRIAISACEQCGRNRLPVIHEPQALDSWIAGVQSELKLVLVPAAARGLPATAIRSVALLIGPEGGLSGPEIAAAQTAGFQPWQLGPRIFRTETAPVAALAVLQSVFGDLRQE